MVSPVVKEKYKMLRRGMEFIWPRKEAIELNEMIQRMVMGAVLNEHPEGMLFEFGEDWQHFSFFDFSLSEDDEGYSKSKNNDMCIFSAPLSTAMMMRVAFKSWIDSQCHCEVCESDKMVFERFTKEVESYIRAVCGKYSDGIVKSLEKLGKKDIQRMVDVFDGSASEFEEVELEDIPRCVEGMLLCWREAYEGIRADLATKDGRSKHMSEGSLVYDEGFGFS